MVFHEEFEPFSCDAIPAAVTRPPASSSPPASQELQGVTTSTTSQPFHQTLNKQMRSSENDTWPFGKSPGSKCDVSSLRTVFVFTNKQLNSPALFLTLLL